MKLKIALGQMDVEPGNPEINTEKIILGIKEAKKIKADLVVFPEMAVAGYMLSDLWEEDAFVNDCFAKNKEIIREIGDIGVIWGNVLPNKKRFGNDGRMLKFNAAFAYQNGKPLKHEMLKQVQHDNEDLFPSDGITIKTMLPLYREFEDQRHFLSLREYSQQVNLPLKKLLQPFVLKTKHGDIKIGVVICEDVWTGDYIYNNKILSPAEILVENGAELIIAISASPFTWLKNQARERKIREIQKRLADRGRPTPFVYVNCVGAQNNGKNEFVFDGRSTVFDQFGEIVYEAPAWKEGLYIKEIEVKIQKSKFRIASQNAKVQNKILTKIEQRKEMREALVYGIRKFAQQKGIENFVVGLSGGIDSAMVAALCVEAIGKDHVFGINMPTKFNSEWTKGTAAYVAKQLKISYQIIAIEDLVKLVRRKIGGDGIGGKVDENLQARIRSADILAGIASKSPNTVYTSNGNKTEIILGYFTLDGDGRGAICPLGDVFKTQICDLAIDWNLEWQKKYGKVLFPWELLAPLFDGERYYENWDCVSTPIPKNTRKLVPSAELSKEQNVEEGRGDPIIFNYHDYLLREFIEYRKNPEDILRNFKIDPSKYFISPREWISDLEKVWKLYHLAVFKQIQSPPIITVSKRSLGYDFRRSQLPAYFTKNYIRLKKKIIDRHGRFAPSR